MDQILHFLALVTILSRYTPNSIAVTDISREDIRDAVLSLKNLINENTDKLERHEFREKQFTEQVKKAFASMDKRLKTQDGKLDLLMTGLTNLTTRLIGFEESLTAQISSQLNTKSQPMYIIPENKTPEWQVLSEKLDNMGSIISRLEDKVMGEFAKSKDLAQDSTNNIVKELKASAYNTEIALKSKDANSNLKETLSIIHQTINDAKFEVLKITEKSRLNLEDKLIILEKSHADGQSQLMKSITDNTEMTENLFTDVQKSYDQLSKEVKALVKVEQVLIQTADNVLDMKRRIEYGTHQILVEMGDLVRLSSKELNSTINYRFDNLTSTIDFNHNYTLVNLSAKVENEMSQVWRQIGIMYSTLTASADVLNKVKEQTEVYINETHTTLGGMEVKVGKITEHMSDVEGNLNYLLGRLSLVTHEFNDIKIGLGNALDQMRGTFTAVQSKVNDSNPGPKQIPDLESHTVTRGLLVERQQYLKEEDVKFRR